MSLVLRLCVLAGVPAVAALTWVASAPLLWDVVTVLGAQQFLFTAAGLLWVVAYAYVHTRRLVRLTPGGHLRMFSRQAAATPPQLRATAEHEAAHAVTAWALGGRVLEVSVNSRTGDGLTCWVDSPGWTAEEAMWAGLVVSMAGNQADLAAGRHVAGSWDDIEKAQRHAAALLSIGRLPDGVDCVLSTDALLTAARDQASALLDTHAVSAHRVAATLVRHHRHRPWRNPDLGDPPAAPWGASS